MLEDMVGPGEARAIQLDRTRMEQALAGDRIFSISCELGVRNPSLRAMMNRAYFASALFGKLPLICLYLSYAMYMLCIYHTNSWI